MNPRELLPDIINALSKTASIAGKVLDESIQTLVSAAANTIQSIERAKPTTDAPPPQLPLTNVISKPAELTSDNSSQKKPVKKGRFRTDCSANVTASLSLEGETKKTLNEHSLVVTGYAYLFRGAAPAKYVDSGLDIATEMVSLEKDLSDESKKPKEIADADMIEGYQIRKIKLVEDQIVEHAARRVDLYFYLLIAVYGKNVTAEKDETTKQHGKGSDERGTAGCHSSLFPGIKFRYINNSGLSFFSQQSPGECPLLDGTYFAEALNATVELPKLVNDFDGHIEGRSGPTTYVKDSINIINRVAKKEINPIQGMNEFYKVMDEYFSYFKRKYLTTNVKARLVNWRAHQHVWDYEKEGTFSGANEDLSINSRYLNMILKINSLTSVLPYDHYFKVIQKEILESKVEQKKTKKPTR